MCLAIAPSRQCSNSLFARIWRQISSTPLRLFSLSAVFHLLLGTGIIAYSVSMDAQLSISALLSALLYGVLAFFVFGSLMTWLPEKYSLSPVHYGRYSSVYLLMFIALLMIEVGALTGSQLVLAGTLLLVPAWLIALQSINNIHDWIPSGSQGLSKAILFLLLTLFISLIAGIVASVAGGYDDVVPALAPFNLVTWSIIMLVLTRMRLARMGLKRGR